MSTELVENALDADPKLRLLSHSKLIATLRKLNAGTTKKAIEAAVNAYFAANRDVTRERFKRPSTKHKQAKITSPPASFQIDIGFFPAYKAANKGIDSFLLAVDIISRKAWAIPLKSGKVKDLVTAYKQFLAEAKEGPNWSAFKVEADDQFDASQFVDFNEKRGTAVVTGVAKDDHIAAGDRLGIVDRLMRTLKVLVAKKIAADDDAKWTTWLPDIVKLYNSTPHDGLSASEGKPTTPDELYADNRASYFKWRRELAANGAVAAKVAEKFTTGMFVRILLRKGAFDKESAGPPMSLEVYKVVAVKGTRISVVDAATGEAYGRPLKPVECAQVAAPSEETPAPARPSKAEKVAKRAKAVKKVKSKAVGIEPAPEAAVEEPLRTRAGRARAKAAAKAPAPEAAAPSGHDGNYIVHAVVDDKVFKVNGRSIVKYRVRWEGYPDPDEDTWELKTTLSYNPGARQLLDDYLRAKKNRAAAGKRVQMTRKKK